MALDLALALARLEVDFRYGRTFFLHPYELALVNQHRREWLDRIATQLNAKMWHPTRPSIANIPKGGGAVRPGALLTLNDRVVYTALVGAALPAIVATIDLGTPLRDYAYRIRKPETRDWVSAPVWCWEEFRKKSLQYLRPAVNCVVATDITACYEHIDHEILKSDLRAAGVEKDVLDLLATSLAKWAPLNGRGLPQNLTASHLLAKLYLARVDQGMVARGHNHLRYVDDIRIFADSKANAKRALLDLAVILRDRGLSLQSAKTEFLSKDEARATFEGSLPALRALLHDYLAAIAKEVGLDPDYITPEEAEELINTAQASVPVGLLQDAYTKHILTSSELDKTLFHFLIRRLGKARDPFAVTHCLSILEPHPEETRDVLSYLGAVLPLKAFEDMVLDYFESPNATYEYQSYELLHWRLNRPEAASGRLLAFVRKILTAGNAADFLVSIARAAIGRHGHPADLDALVRAYGSATADLERASIVCAVARMERGLRNGFLGRVKDDGPLCTVAVASVRASVSWYSA